MITGGGTAAGGVVVAASGVGAVAGAGVATVGAAVATHGAMMTFTAVKNMAGMKQKVDNASNNSDRKVNPKKEAREAGKEKRNNQPGSEKRAKDYGKAVEKKEGKDARRQAHDAKEKGVKNRTVQELKEDYKQK